MKGSESSLRAALQSAFGDFYPDPATVQRIVENVQWSSRRAPIPAWARLVVAGGAAIAAAVVVIVTLLSTPRVSVPGMHPSTPPSPAPRPSFSVINIKKASMGLGIGLGRVTLDAHDLPANAKVTVAVAVAGGSTEIISTTADAQGNANGTAWLPASITLTGLSADFTICVTVPDASTVPGWRGTICSAQSVPVPSSSIPTPTP